LIATNIAQKEVQAACIFNYRTKPDIF